VESLRAFLNCRESMASQTCRTRRSGIPPAKPNLDAIRGPSRVSLGFEIEKMVSLSLGLFVEFGSTSVTMNVRNRTGKLGSVWERPNLR